MVTETFPAVARGSALAMIVVPLGWENVASTPLNLTDLVEANPLPEIVTVVATGPARFIYSLVLSSSSSTVHG